MFRGSNPQEDSFFQTLSPQQKQQYLQLKQKQAAEALQQQHKNAEQKLFRNVQQQSKLFLEQQSTNPAPVQIITVTSTPQLQQQQLSIQPIGQIQSQPIQIQIRSSSSNTLPTVTAINSPPPPSTQIQTTGLYGTTRIPGQYKSKLSQSSWRNLIASRYNTKSNPLFPSSTLQPGDIAPSLPLINMPIPSNAPIIPQQPILDVTPEHFNDLLPPGTRATFLHGAGLPPPIHFQQQYTNNNGNSQQMINHPHQQQQQQYPQHLEEVFFLDPLEILFNDEIDIDDEFQTSHHLLRNPHRHQIDPFGRRLQSSLQPHQQQQPQPHHRQDSFFGRDPFFDSAFGQRGSDPFFESPFGRDPFEMMMGGHNGHGGMMNIDPIARMMMAPHDIMHTTGGRDSLGNQMSSMTNNGMVSSFSSSSSMMNDGIVKKTSSWSSNSFDGMNQKPQRQSFSSSTVTRVGPDGIARTEKSEEEIADDGTEQGKKHKKIVSTEVQDSGNLINGFLLHDSRRITQQQQQQHQHQPVTPVAEVQRIETDFTSGDTKIIHQRRIGDKQHQHITAIHPSSSSSQQVAPEVQVYDELEGLSAEELDQFNQQFAQYSTKLTPPETAQGETSSSSSEQQPKKKWSLW